MENGTQLASAPPMQNLRMRFSKPQFGLLCILALAVAPACSSDLLEGLADAGPPDATPRTPASIVFVNTSPTQFTPGTGTDSVTNITGIVSNIVSTTGVTSTEIWSEAVTCLRNMLTPYHVVVVEEDPGDVDHIEIAVSNEAEDIGLSGNITGQAVGTCSALPRGIAFAFDSFPNDAESTCHSLGWLLGHTVGIDTLYHCADVTTYLAGCGPKSFTDRESECGEYEARDCQCGGTTQNSHQKMLDFYGPSQ
jgi:hypothetical protein